MTQKNQAKWLHWLLPLVCSMILVFATPSVFAETEEFPTPDTAESQTPSEMISLPAPAHLEYVVRVKYTAMSIGGRSFINWEHDESEYSIETNARCNLLGQILKTSSKGDVGQQYLKPYVFTEKRRNRDETEVTFDYANKMANFSETQRDVPFVEGVQDRSSVVWQLAAYAKAHPEKIIPGNKITLQVAGRKRIDQWDIEIGEDTTRLTALGDMRTVYFIRTDSKGKTTEVWLAPEMEWYPVELIFSDNKDLRLEQLIKKIIKK